MLYAQTNIHVPRPRGGNGMRDGAPTMISRGEALPSAADVQAAEAELARLDSIIAEKPSEEMVARRKTASFAARRMRAVMGACTDDNLRRWRGCGSVGPQPPKDETIESKTEEADALRRELETMRARNSERLETARARFTEATEKKQEGRAKFYAELVRELEGSNS